MKTMKECQTEEGGSDVDIEPFIKHEMLKTQKSKCILACINDKIGYVRLFFLPLRKILFSLPLFLLSIFLYLLAFFTSSCRSLSSKFSRFSLIFYLGY